MCYQSRNVKVENLKVLSYASETVDGLDIAGTIHVTTNHSFFNTFDDAIAIKTDKFVYAGNVEDVRVSNCSIWKEAAGNALNSATKSA